MSAEEILRSRSALWMSADGHMVLYATFNDSLVQQQRYPWYGDALDTDDPQKAYPQIRSVRYPKPGTNNPTVTLTVADIADPKHIRSRHLTPPKAIVDEGDYYMTSAQWVSLTEVCVVWLTRPQNLSVVSVCKSPMWYCLEVYRISSGIESWVEPAPAPLWSAGGGALATLAPVRDGPAGLFRHVVRVEHNSHGPRALPLTHGSFDVVKLLAWDHANHHILWYFDNGVVLLQLLPGHTGGKPGQQHLYRVSADAPRAGSPQKLPYCVTCKAQPSPSINLEYYGNLASTGDSAWDSDWEDELLATSPAPHRRRRKKDDDSPLQPQPCLYHEAHFSPSSAYFVLECLGPGVPAARLYRAALPEPRLVAHLQNNSAVKKLLNRSKETTERQKRELPTELLSFKRAKERLSAIALPTPRTFAVQLSSGHTARVRLLLPPGAQGGRGHQVSSGLDRAPVHELTPITNENIHVSVSKGRKYSIFLPLSITPSMNPFPSSSDTLFLPKHGAPGTQLVTEKWSFDWEALAAGAGAVLAAVDARGAGGGGLGAHHALHRRLGTIELADQLEVAELELFGVLYRKLATIAVLAKRLACCIQTERYQARIVIIN
ncbi:Inactive dipeptidyl peptidase 10 [Eumeta japonica]|uniref:Inactive dipeptidyl peptidase 10 n=1 Tax=Eumeta variegata TaxID=151549 RepID=A0A4C1Z594_EUMVA|nr:Inactive dipeptidyl peptidase 10 [Eumeta japonica]